MGWVSSGGEPPCCCGCTCSDSSGCSEGELFWPCCCVGGEELLRACCAGCCHSCCGCGSAGSGCSGCCRGVSSPGCPWSCCQLISCWCSGPTAACCCCCCHCCWLWPMDVGSSCTLRLGGRGGSWSGCTEASGAGHWPTPGMGCMPEAPMLGPSAGGEGRGMLVPGRVGSGEGKTMAGGVPADRGISGEGRGGRSSSWWGSIGMGTAGGRPAGACGSWMGGGRTRSSSRSLCGVLPCFWFESGGEVCSGSGSSGCCCCCGGGAGGGAAGAGPSMCAATELAAAAAVLA